MPDRVSATSRRAIPAVEKVLQSVQGVDLPRSLVVAVVRRELSALRAEKKIPSFDSIVQRIRDNLVNLHRSRLQPVINGTGIIIHTNFGRAPLAPEAVVALTSIASSYCNLEYDLSSGERGSRAAYLEQNLALLCGAESATLVNNCAAALVLIVRHFTKKKTRSSFRAVSSCRSAADFASAKFSRRLEQSSAKSVRPTKPRSPIMRPRLARIRR